MADNQGKICKFIAQSTRNLTDQGACVRIELRQIVEGAANRPMQSWPIKDVSAYSGDDAVDTLAAEILDYAQEDANAYSTPNQYMLAAYFGNESNPSSRSPAFRLSGVSSLVEAGPSETPDQKGVTTAAMRWVGDIIRGSVGHTAIALEAQSKIIDRQAQMLERYDKNKMDVFEMMEGLFKHRHEQELEVIREKHKIHKQTAIIDELKMYAPMLLNHITGKQLLPAEHPLIGAATQAFKGMPMDAFEEFLGKCPEHVRLGWIEVFKHFAGKIASENEKAQAAQ